MLTVTARNPNPTAVFGAETNGSFDESRKRRGRITRIYET